MDAIAEIGSAFLTIAPSLKGFDSKLNASAGASIRSSGKSLGSVFGKAFVLGGAVLAAAGIGSFLKDSIGEAREAQKVGALTANVIKTTGGAAKISAKQVGDLATSLSLKTGVDDEAIQSGSNLLLTFKGIKREGSGLNDIFGRATAAAVDLSASGFGDINGASKQLGKALNDPVKGITALAKSGVTFTDQQKTQIKTLVESGDTLSAQKIILKELESQVGGAAAATSTYGEKASVAFGNVKEQVGTALLPVLDGFFKLFLGSVPTITKLINGIGPAFQRVGSFLSPLIAAVKNVVRAFGFLFDPSDTDAARGFGEVIDYVFGNTGKLIGPLAQVGAVLRTVIQEFQNGLPNITAFVGAVVASIQTNFVPVLKTIATTLTTTIIPAISSFVSYVAAALLPIFRSLVNIIITQVLPIYRSLAIFFYGTLIPAIVQIATTIASKFKPVFDQLVTTFRSSVLPTLQTLLAKFREAQPALQKIALTVVKLYGKFLTFQVAIAAKVLPVVIRLAGFLIRTLVPVIANVIVAIVKAIAKIIDFGHAVVNGVKAFTTFATGVKDKIGLVTGYVKALPGKIKGFFTGLPGELKVIGGNIIDGLKKGITDAGQKVLSAVQGIIDKIPKFIRKRLGIASPSKVTTKLGEYTSEGLARGIANGAKKAAEAAKKLVDGVKDALKGRISGLQDDFSSLADSVSSAFTGNLFEATNAGDFIKNLLGTQGQLQSLKAAFKTLLGYGLQPGFLSQLFASGNAGLILDLAAQDQATATQAGTLFGNVTDLSSQLGNNVAQADVGPKLDKQIDLLQQLVGLSGGQAVALAKEINGAATGGKKKGNKGKGKK